MAISRLLGQPKGNSVLGSCGQVIVHKHSCVTRCQHAFPTYTFLPGVNTYLNNQTEEEVGEANAKDDQTEDQGRWWSQLVGVETNYSLNTSEAENLHFPINQE